MQKITPFLWFDGKAEEATIFHTAVFKNSKIKEVTRMGPNGPVMSATFELEGQEYYAFNGGPMFTFTEAISLFVSCDTQEEIDMYWEKFSEGGKKSRCGWLKDKFGLSWQIVPPILGTLLGDKDPVKSKRVMDAMLGMTKLEIAALKKAHEG